MTRPVTPKEAAKALRAGLSADACQLVEFLNDQLRTHGRGQAAVSGDRGSGALDQAAALFQAEGWRVRTGYQAGILGRTVEGYVVPPAWTIEVTR